MTFMLNVIKALMIKCLLRHDGGAGSASSKDRPKVFEGESFGETLLTTSAVVKCDGQEF